MSKKIIRFKVTKNLYLKEVNLSDVNYILKLRTNKKLSKYLNPTNPDKKKQLIWLEKYLIRRKNNKEFYFIFQIKIKKDYKNMGFGRIVHLKKNIFHFGGWILEKNSKPWIALESCLSIYEYAFINLRYKKCLLWINLKNSDVIKYHEYLGSKYVKKSKKEIFFKFTKKNYEDLKKKFIFYY